MTTPHSRPENLPKLTNAYDKMMERLHSWFINLEHDSYPALQKGLEESRLLGTELDSLSHEESLLIRDYIKRDLHSAAQYMHKNREDLQAWLQFDIEQVETSLLNVFRSMTNHTQKELQHLASNAHTWKTGEITGIGTLQCRHCGEKMHFKKTSHIPPCPHCAKTFFKREEDA